MENFSNVSLSLQEYEALKSEISSLKTENEKLKAERNQLCEENKVRIIHKETIISNPIPCWRLDMLSQVETTRDELVNFEDIEELVKKEIKDKLSEDLDKANKENERLTEEIAKSNINYASLQEAYTAMSKNYCKLLNRNLWQRIINKTE